MSDFTTIRTVLISAPLVFFTGTLLNGLMALIRNGNTVKLYPLHLSWIGLATLLIIDWVLYLTFNILPVSEDNLYVEVLILLSYISLFLLITSLFPGDTKPNTTEGKIFDYAIWGQQTCNKRPFYLSLILFNLTGIALAFMVDYYQDHLPYLVTVKLIVISGYVYCMFSGNGKLHWQTNLATWAMVCIDLYYRLVI